jgi:hypothetical protein
MRDQSIQAVALGIAALASIFFVAGALFRVGLYRPETWVKPFQEGRLPAVQRQLAFSMFPGGGAVVAVALTLVVTMVAARLALLGIALGLAGLAMFIWRAGANLGAAGMDSHRCNASDRQAEPIERRIVGMAGARRRLRCDCRLFVSRLGQFF